MATRYTRVSSPAQVDADVAEVHPGLSVQRMTPGNGHVDKQLALATSNLGQVPPHHRLADFSPMLVD